MTRRLHQRQSIIAAGTMTIVFTVLNVVQSEGSRVVAGLGTMTVCMVMASVVILVQRRVEAGRRQPPRGVLTQAPPRKTGLISLGVLVLTWLSGALFWPLPLVVAVVGTVLAVGAGVRGPWLIPLGLAVVMGGLLTFGTLTPSESGSRSPAPVVPVPSPPS